MKKRKFVTTPEEANKLLKKGWEVVEQSVHTSTAIGKMETRFDGVQGVPETHTTSYLILLEKPSSLEPAE